MKLEYSAAALVVSLGLVLGFATTTASAATRTIVAGQLVGATGVNVGGNLYDVAFVEGICTALFSGCDSPSDFDFSTIASASTASQALFNQVLLDGVDGLFDSQPDLTFGCESTVECRILTPYRSSIAASQLLYMYPRNHADDSLDAVLFGSGQVAGINPFADTTLDPIYVFARWTAVPEPSVALLLGLGLFGLGTARKSEAARR